MRRRSSLASRVVPRRRSSLKAQLCLIDVRCQYVRKWSILAWIVSSALLLCAQLVEPFKGGFMYLQTSERIASTAGALIGLCMISYESLLAAVLRRLDGLMGQRLAFPARKSGLRQLSDAVQWMALLTDLMMALVKVPVVLDPILGTRVHLMRWLEWTVAGYGMTFMIEVIDLAQHEEAHYLASMQTASTAFALIFPFAPNVYVWSFLMFLSFLLYLTLFPRMIQKQKRVQALLKSGTRKSIHGSRNSVVDAVDSSERREASRIVLASTLLDICVVVWSCFVLVFFLEPATYLFLKNRAEKPTWPFIVNCLLHTIVKLFFSGFIAACDQSLLSIESQQRQFNDNVATVIGNAWLDVPYSVGLVKEQHNGAILCALAATVATEYLGVDPDNWAKKAPQQQNDDIVTDFDDKKKPQQQTKVVPTNSEEESQEESQEDLQTLRRVVAQWGNAHGDTLSIIRSVAESLAQENPTYENSEDTFWCQFDKSKVQQVYPETARSKLRSAAFDALVYRALAAKKQEGCPVIVPWKINGAVSPVTAIFMGNDTTLLLINDVSRIVDDSKKHITSTVLSPLLDNEETQENNVDEETQEKVTIMRSSLASSQGSTIHLQDE